MQSCRSNYVDSSFGQLHFTEQGHGPVLLLLHQAPRSWDEFREFLPLMAPHRRVIAMDMVGYGASAALEAPHTIELYAQSALELLDGLGIASADVLGHHTGALVALDLAARMPHRVDHLILSSCPYTGPDQRKSRARAGGVDQVEQSEDGQHLLQLWQLRLPHYPHPAAPLLDRFVHDALAHRGDPAEGHKACGRYRIEDTIGSVNAPTLLLGASADTFAMPHMEALHNGLENSVALHSAVVDGGTVAFFEDKAPEIAEASLAFLTREQPLAETQ
ncbi:alpha/beta fold hydrolase [Rhodococcoides yunnanense]|uniref:alpha/beta fold hydrolase n=1 Tax=Rhodococcoides yunnanense TaxID=278209 RepID=UPI000934EB2D|nr:alpha/beta hydrolase [Rhodococcus yunnanensis]